jgi:hypothetical protein
VVAECELRVRAGAALGLLKVSEDGAELASALVIAAGTSERFVDLPDAENLSVKSVIEHSSEPELARRACDFDKRARERNHGQPAVNAGVLGIEGGRPVRLDPRESRRVRRHEDDVDGMGGAPGRTKSRRRQHGVTA